MTGERKQNVNQSWSTPRPSLFVLLLHHFCVKLSHFYVILFGIHHGGNSAVGIRGTRFYQRISGQMFPKLSGGPGCLPVHADFCEQLYREYLFFWLPRYFDALPEKNPSLPFNDSIHAQVKNLPVTWYCSFFSSLKSSSTNYETKPLSHN